ncbi:hypothetical protein QYE76_034434 [Lolium multiflorum]|uniref:Uncharacterized protein n=1 Tax=Lolium multiflorum TaxID=4521 RepID=A0AAD8VMJ4_LOLMU|nr:hypothetical protein QYE76_034434 [Lolium multiflorum]
MEEEIDEPESSLDEKEEEIDEPESSLDEKEEEIDEPESSLDEKEEEIDEPECSLDEKEEESDEQKEEEWISYPCQPSNESNSLSLTLFDCPPCLPKEGECYVPVDSLEIEPMEEEIDEPESSLDEKEEEIDEPESSLDEKEEEIDEPESSLDEKEEEIDEPECSLDEKEEESDEQKEEEWISYPCQPSNESNSLSLTLFDCPPCLPEEVECYVPVDSLEIVPMSNTCENDYATVIYDNPCYFDKSYDNALFMPDVEMHAATWCRCGNHVLCRRPVVDVAGDTGFPRGRMDVRRKEDNEANTMVVAPLQIGHRSMHGGEGRRQCSRANDAAVLRHAIERAKYSSRCSYVCWRSATAAATAGRGVGVAVASSRASSDEDEDDDVSSSFSTRNGSWAAMGCAGLGLLGRLAGYTARFFTIWFS